MKTADEELRPETVDTLDLREDIGFLLKDEVEAIDGYDKVLSRAELTEEQKSILQEIRNDELDHVNKLNGIYKTLATGEIEEDNDLVDEHEDAEVKDSAAYTLFGDVFEPDANGMKVNGKYFTKEKMEEIYNRYKNVNIINRPSAILFYQAYFKKTYPMNNFKKIGDAYKAKDSVKDSKYIIQHKDNPNSTVGEDGLFHFGGVRGAKRYNTRQEAEGHADAMSSDWKDLYNIVEVKDSNIDDNYSQLIKDADYKEANVNEPLNPMCDECKEVEDGFAETLLSKGLGVLSDLRNYTDSAEMVEEIMGNAVEAHESITDTDTANDIGLISSGDKYRWDEMYGNTLLTVLEAEDEIKLGLDTNGAYVELPRDKFEKLLREGKIVPVDSVDIEKYGKVVTAKDYRVKVGDRTFIVSAKSPKDAKNKVKSKLGE